MDANGEPTQRSDMSRHDRAAIEVHYLPARRDSLDHIAYTAASLLGRMLRAADWTDERTEQAFEPEGEEHQDREHYAIGGMNEADWALRKLAQARRRIDEIGALAQAEVRRINDWNYEAIKSHVRDAEYFESILRNWHEEQLTDDPRRKTISLPGGKLVAAKNPDAIAIDDELFIPWALEHAPEWVRTKYESAKSEVKKASGVVPDTGEIAPGVEVVPGELRWKAVTE